MHSKRTLFIGDVHGCYDELLKLLEKAKYSSADRLIFLGDLINKGPFSLKVLDFVMNGDHECVMGNHELAFIMALRGRRDLIKDLKALHEQMGDQVLKYRSWIEKRPYYIEEDDFIAVHAGLAPKVKLADQEHHVLTHIRTWDGNGDDLNCEKDPAWYELYEGEKKVIFGHWAQKGLVKGSHYIGLDTGCCWGGSLSLYILEEDEIISTKALKQYKSPGIKNSTKF